MYIKRLLKKRIMISSITIMILLITLISSSYAIFMDSKTDINEQVLTVGDLLITYIGGSAINANGITPITDEVAYQKVDNIYTFTIKNEGAVPYKYKIYLEDNPNFIDKNLLNHNYIRYDLNNEGVNILGEKSGGTIFEGVLKGNTTKEYTLRLWVGIEGLPNSAIGSEIHLNIMVDGRAEDGEEIKVLKDAILAQGGGAEAIIARGNPDFSKISPEVLSYEEGLFPNQSVSLPSNITGNKTIGTGYTFNALPGEYTLTGTSTNQTYNSSAIGKYTCNNTNTICTSIYKILEVEVSGASTNYSQDAGTTYTLALTSSANKMVATSYTFDGSTGNYALSGTKYSSVSYSSSYLNYYTCHNNTGTCVELYKINTVSGTSVTNSTKYYRIANYNYIKKIDKYDVVGATWSTDQGLYAAQDEYGTSYYYRGDKETLNNNLLFGDFQWKIIRINGDGSIRIIYNGECPNNNCTISDTGIETQIVGTHAWNTWISDASAVGYMHGGGLPSTSRITDVANVNYALSTNAAYNQINSNAKELMDLWYQNNISGKQISNKVVNNIFCNDRQLANEVGGVNSGPGYGSSAAYTSYAADYRIATNKIPILRCGLKNDRFTVSDTILGNGVLTYPVGLISADEVAMAGLVFQGKANTTNFLYTELAYWSMTPRYHMADYYDGSYMYCVNSSGMLDVLYGPADYKGLRPVINISKDVLVSGTGSLEDPFIVK